MNNLPSADSSVNAYDTPNTQINYINTNPVEDKSKSSHKLTRFFKRVVPGAILGGALSVVTAGLSSIVLIGFDMLSANQSNTSIAKVVSDELDKGKSLKEICKELWNGCSTKKKICTVALVISALALCGLGIFVFIVGAPVTLPFAISLGLLGAVCGGYISMGGFGTAVGFGHH